MYLVAIHVRWHDRVKGLRKCLCFPANTSEQRWNGNFRLRCKFWRDHIPGSKLHKFTDTSWQYESFKVSEVCNLAKQLEHSVIKTRPGRVGPSILGAWNEEFNFEQVVGDSWDHVQPPRTCSKWTLLHTTLRIHTISNAFELLQNCVAKVLFLEKWCSNSSEHLISVRHNLLRLTHERSDKLSVQYEWISIIYSMYTDRPAHLAKADDRSGGAHGTERHL